MESLIGQGRDRFLRGISIIPEAHFCLWPMGFEKKPLSDELLCQSSEVGRGAERAGWTVVRRGSRSMALLDAASATSSSAWWLAMRIKGETPESWRRSWRRCRPAWRFGSTPVVCRSPCCPATTARDNCPNLTPLLAWALYNAAPAFYCMACVRTRPRVTTFELFPGARFPVASSAPGAGQALTSSACAFAPD